MLYPFIWWYCEGLGHVADTYKVHEKGADGQWYTTEAHRQSVQGRRLEYGSALPKYSIPPGGLQQWEMLRANGYGDWYDEDHPGSVGPCREIIFRARKHEVTMNFDLDDPSDYMSAMAPLEDGRQRRSGRYGRRVLYYCREPCTQEQLCARPALMFKAAEHEDATLLHSKLIRDIVTQYFTGTTPEEREKSAKKRQRTEMRHNQLMERFEEHQTWRNGVDPGDGRPRSMFLLGKADMKRMRQRWIDTQLAHGWDTESARLVCAEITLEMMPELEDDVVLSSEIEQFMLAQMPLCVRSSAYMEAAKEGLKQVAQLIPREVGIRCEDMLVAARAIQRWQEEGCERGYLQGAL